MNALRRLIRWMVPAVCAVLASCIDGSEEYWLAADGSGRAEIRYEVPASFATSLGGISGVEDLLDRFVRETPTLHHVTRAVTRRHDRLTVELKGDFKSVRDLIAAVSGDSALTPAGGSSPLEPLIGDFAIQQAGTRVNFERTVHPGRAIPGSALLPASQFKGRRLVYQLHLPVAARDSNATRTADGGRTLIWERPLDGGMLKPLALRFEADLPLPWHWLAAGVGGTGLLAALAVYALRRRRNRRTAEPPVT